MSLPLPLIIAGVAGALLIAGGKKKGSKSSSKRACDMVAFSYSEIPMTLHEGSSIPLAAIKANDEGEKDSIVLAKVTLTPFMPMHCMEDSSVMVTVVDGTETAVLSAPTLVFIMATKIAVELSGIGRYTLGEKLDQVKNLSNWWSQVSPGQPIPNVEG